MSPTTSGDVAPLVAPLEGEFDSEYELRGSTDGPSVSRRVSFAALLASVGSVLLLLGSQLTLGAHSAVDLNLLEGQQMCSNGFPRDFVWGLGTSAYQIEGGANLTGREPSIWDTFSHFPGKIHDGDTGDWACDHIHRFREDVKAMRSIGLRHSRFYCPS